MERCLREVTTRRAGECVLPPPSWCYG